MTIEMLTAKFDRLSWVTREWLAGEAAKYLDAFSAQDWRVADVAYSNITTYIPLGGSGHETPLALEFLLHISN